MCYYIMLDFRDFIKKKKNSNNKIVSYISETRPGVYYYNSLFL